MKSLIFLTIWLDDIALLLGMLFMTDIQSYKIYVVFIICMDIIGTIFLGYFFNKDKKRVANIMKSVKIETMDNKLKIEGNKDELIALLKSVHFVTNKVNSDRVKLIIDREEK